MHAGGTPPPTAMPAEPPSEHAVDSEPVVSGGEMDVDAMDDDTNNVDARPDAAEPKAATDVEMEDLDAHTGQDEPPTTLPEEAPDKPRPIRRTTANKMSDESSTTSKKVAFLSDDDDVSPLGKSRESKSKDISNIQELKNHVPQFMESATPRSFNSAHFIISEGGIDWTRGRPPLCGKARSLRVIEWLASMLQREEDQNKNDFDYRGASRVVSW